MLSGWASCIASWATVVTGEDAPGISGIRAALNAAQATGTKHFQTYFFGVLADACLLAGRIDEGLAAVHTGLEAARTSNERFYEAELLRLEGELERSNNTGTEQCAALLERAVELAKHQAAHLLELRALTSLFRTSEAQSCSTDLLHRLGAVLGKLARQPDSTDVREARSLLRGSQRNPTAIP
jgi:predicted ATPase